MNKIIKYFLLGFLGVSVILMTVFLIKKSIKPREHYQVTSPEIKNIIKKTVATGAIVPRNESEIRPRVSGIVAEIYVEAGEMVKEGDKIAKIRIVPDMLNLNNAEARVEQAKINYKDKKIIYDRQKGLFEKEVIPLAEYEKAELAFNMADQELKAAENNLQIIKEGISKDAAKATNTIVRSTITGMVLDVPVKEGFSVIETNTFNPGTTIATVADMNEMIFEGKVDETEVGKIKTGMDLLLDIGAIDDVTFHAKLTYIAPKGVQETGAIQFDIKADVELKNDYFIRSGYSANADIVLDKKDSVLAIEEKNLIFEGDDVYVEVEKDTMVFEKKKVELGISDGIYTEVISGIDKDTKIKIQ
jgi:HlyD family secretion protein